MSQREWLTSAIYDFRDKFGINLLDPEVDYVETAFLIQVLENTTDSFIGAKARKQDLPYDNLMVIVGELFKAYVMANSKNKQKIKMPWDKKPQVEKMKTGSISIEEARELFSTVKPAPRKMPDGDVLK